MWEVGHFLVCWGLRIVFFVMSTSSVRQRSFSDLLNVTIAKEDDSVLPYGVMVRLGGYKDK
jgi:hypothetical protein